VGAFWVWVGSCGANRRGEILTERMRGCRRTNEVRLLVLYGILYNSN
jgi:hypothetical protein